MDFSQLNGVINDVLGGGSLANVDVDHGAYVPVHLKVDFCLFGRGYVIFVRHLGLILGALDAFQDTGMEQEEMPYLEGT